MDIFKGESEHSAGGLAALSLEKANLIEIKTTYALDDIVAKARSFRG
jgi:hypothetical protein